MPSSFSVMALQAVAGPNFIGTVFSCLWLRSFPLTEEEYLLWHDDVANTLKCWGAVSHISNSVAKLKERPQIGKTCHLHCYKMVDRSSMKFFN